MFFDVIVPFGIDGKRRSVGKPSVVLMTFYDVLCWNMKLEKGDKN